MLYILGMVNVRDVVVIGDGKNIQLTIRVNMLVYFYSAKIATKLLQKKRGGKPLIRGKRVA
jgi:hypothetical protein